MSDDAENSPREKPGGPGAEPRAKKHSPKPPLPPVIAIRMEALLQWVVERVAKFPRDHKFTVGDRLIETCLDVTCALVEASYKRDKVHELGQASRALVRARLLFRLARALHCVSEAQHLHFAKESDEIGRMLGGWLRATASR